MTIGFDSEYVTASFDTLQKQASDTVSMYLRRAKDEIDDVFGDGYADENPQLVAAFIQAGSRLTCNQLKIQQGVCLGVE